MEGILTGKIAVVTGGSAGIGYAVAKRFATAGAKVILASRNLQRLETAARNIGNEAVAIPTDVSDFEQVQRLFEGLERVDVLVTCAGAALFGEIDAFPIARAKLLFEGRFFGQLAAAHYAVPKMPPESVIVFCSGIAASIGLPYYSAGSALCGAVNSMARALAVELAPRGIRVNAISPGLIEGTDIQSNLSKEQSENFAELTKAKIPLKRAGQPDEVAEAVFSLAICSYITGQIIEVDGGWTASQLNFSRSRSGKGGAIEQRQQIDSDDDATEGVLQNFLSSENPSQRKNPTLAISSGLFLFFVPLLVDTLVESKRKNHI